MCISNYTSNRGRVLVRQLLKGEIEVVEFCDAFENWWNFLVEKSDVNAALHDAYDQLFNIVVWYSPFPEEKEQIINYKSEEEVMEAARKFIRTVDE